MATTSLPLQKQPTTQASSISLAAAAMHDGSSLFLNFYSGISGKSRATRQRAPRNDPRSAQDCASKARTSFVVDPSVRRSTTASISRSCSGDFSSQNQNVHLLYILEIPAASARRPMEVLDIGCRENCQWSHLSDSCLQRGGGYKWLWALG